MEESTGGVGAGGDVRDCVLWEGLRWMGRRSSLVQGNGDDEVVLVILSGHWVYLYYLELFDYSELLVDSFKVSVGLR